MGKNKNTGSRGKSELVRVIISFILLVLVVFLITSNTFWRWMYPIRYQGEIQYAAEYTKVDPLLVASVIRTESKFRNEDVSHAGAIGLMQLMPDTASWIVRRMQNDHIGPLVLESHDKATLSQPKANIMIGSYYVNYLIQRFHGNQVAAIAAYNGGPQRVQEWLSNGTWDGRLETIDHIPVGETRHFVDRVFYNYEMYQRIYGQQPGWTDSKQQ